MLSLLSRIWCVIGHLDEWVLKGAVMLVNFVILALGTFLGVLVDAIPIDMSALPTIPDEFITISTWVAWFFPVFTLVSILAFYLAVWLMWNVVGMCLRWVKAV